MDGDESNSSTEILQQRKARWRAEAEAAIRRFALRDPAVMGALAEGGTLHTEFPPLEFFGNAFLFAIFGAHVIARPTTPSGGDAPAALANPKHQRAIGRALTHLALRHLTLRENLGELGFSLLLLPVAVVFLPVLAGLVGMVPLLLKHIGERGWFVSAVLAVIFLATFPYTLPVLVRNIVLDLIWAKTPGHPESFTVPVPSLSALERIDALATAG